MSAVQTARIVSLQLCVGHREPMQVVKSARVISGFGIEGDRHATSEGVRTARQVVVMDEETLKAFTLQHGEVRENVTTTGIDLASLTAGQMLQLGDKVVLKITGPCAPCARMDEIRPGLKDQLQGKRGLVTYVAQGGIIKVGDTVRVLAGVATS